MASEPTGPGDSGLASQSSSDPAEVAALYDGWAAADYDTDLAAWDYDAPARTATMIIDALADIAGARILDAGCGTGLVGVALRRQIAAHGASIGAGDVTIVGGDFSPASIHVAGRRGVYDDVVHLDLNAPLDFDDRSFDAVVSVGVFSYLTDSRAAVLELLRVTASGGCVVFTQRSDLWAARDFDALLATLVAAGHCTATISDVAPYLPQHPEFGDDIGIRYVTLVSTRVTRTD